MNHKKPIVAILYDFDKTLSTTDMQDYDFIPSLGLTSEQFWSIASKYTEEHGVERTLAYLYTMLNEAKKRNIPLTREYLHNCGKHIIYNPGVETWFKRINEYGEKCGVVVEHYLVSSGTKEIIEGTKIAKEFKEIYGCEFMYDNGVAVWPKMSINFTQKTQYYFRIAKGATSPIDDSGVNQKSEQLRVPYSNIVYLGDGMTDIACMTIVRKNHGYSIAVYPEKDINKVKQIYNDNRCNYIVSSDYRKGSALEKTMQSIIDKIALDDRMKREEKRLASK